MTKRILKSLRFRFKELTGRQTGLLKSNALINLNGGEVSDAISEMIRSGKPFLVSRFGSEELRWYINYKYLNQWFPGRARRYITCHIDSWQADDKIIDNITFRPKSLEMTRFFIRKMDMAIPEIDLLASWLKWEQDAVVKLQCRNYGFLLDLDPFFHERPWTLALKGKKVLVIHPMVEEISRQYAKRDLLFSSPTLPEFNLSFIRSLFFDDPRYPTWESIYNYYLEEVKKADFDVAIIGVGPWGMPLGAEIKKMGKQAIHMGGSTQLLFGIMGNRWLTGDWVQHGYERLLNEHWIYPDAKPSWANNYEAACYWKKED